MQIFGIRINKKTVSLKPFNSLLPDKDERYITSWNVFTQKDIDELQDTKFFESELKQLKEKFKENYFNVGRFGEIIHTNIKDDFIKEIYLLKEDFISYMKNNPTESAKKRFEKYYDFNEIKVEKKNLSTILDNSCKALVERLLKLCPRDAEFLFNTVFSNYRNLRKDYDNNKRNVEEILNDFVNYEVYNRLKFTSADEIIEKIDIKLDFYDISDELLFENEDFNNIIEQYKLDFRINSVGYKPLES